MVSVANIRADSTFFDNFFQQFRVKISVINHWPKATTVWNLSGWWKMTFELWNDFHYGLTFRRYSCHIFVKRMWISGWLAWWMVSRRATRTHFLGERRLWRLWNVLQANWKYSCSLQQVKIFKTHLHFIEKIAFQHYLSYFSELKKLLTLYKKW